MRTTYESINSFLNTIHFTLLLKTSFINFMIIYFSFLHENKKNIINGYTYNKIIFFVNHIAYVIPTTN